MYQHSKNIVTAGLPLEQAKSALVMLHGRGASAQSMIPLSSYLNIKDAAIFAPQAARHSWYPTSFIQPVEENQPALDSALEVIHELVQEIIKAGIPAEKIFFMGFSQGACLTLEYVARNATKFGGVIAFTGGLIGEILDLENYKGDFAQTTILITTGDPDAHVPLKRVKKSAALMEKMNGRMHVMVYPAKQHTISNEEIEVANELFFNSQLNDDL
jgi:phospholipase/carboxylesterase